METAEVKMLFIITRLPVVIKNVTTRQKQTAKVKIPFSIAGLILVTKNIFTWTKRTLQTLKM